MMKRRPPPVVTQSGGAPDKPSGSLTPGLQKTRSTYVSGFLGHANVTHAGPSAVVRSNSFTTEETLVSPVPPGSPPSRRSRQGNISPRAKSRTWKLIKESSPSHASSSSSQEVVTSTVSNGNIEQLQLLNQLQSKKKIGTSKSKRDILQELHTFVEKLDDEKMKERILSTLQQDRSLSKRQKICPGKRQILLKLSLSYLELGNNFLVQPGLAPEICISRALQLARDIAKESVLDDSALHIYFIGVHQLQAKLEFCRGHAHNSLYHLKQIDTYSTKAMSSSSKNLESSKICHLLQLENWVNLASLELRFGMRKEWTVSCAKLKRTLKQLKKRRSQVQSNSNALALVVSSTDDMISAQYVLMELRIRYLIAVFQFTSCMEDICHGQERSAIRRRPRRNKSVRQPRKVHRFDCVEAKYEESMRKFWNSISFPYSDERIGTRQRSLTHARVIQQLRSEAQLMLGNLSIMRKVFVNTTSAAASDAANWNGVGHLSALFSQRATLIAQKKLLARSHPVLWRPAQGANWGSLGIRLHEGVVLWLRRDPPGSALWKLHSRAETPTTVAAGAPMEQRAGRQRAHRSPRHQAQRNQASTREIKALRVQLARQQAIINQQRKAKEQAELQLHGLSSALNQKLEEAVREHRKHKKRQRLAVTKLRGETAKLKQENQELERIVNNPHARVPTPPTTPVGSRVSSPRRRRDMGARIDQEPESHQPEQVLELLRKEAEENKQLMMNCMASMKQALMAEIHTALKTNVAPVAPQIDPTQLREIISEQLRNALHLSADLQTVVPRSSVLVKKSSIAHIVNSDTERNSRNNGVWLLEEGQEVSHIETHPQPESAKEPSKSTGEGRIVDPYARTNGKMLTSSLSSGELSQRPRTKVAMSRSFRQRKRGVYIPNKNELPPKPLEISTSKSNLHKSLNDVPSTASPRTSQVLVSGDTTASTSTAKNRGSIAAFATGDSSSASDLQANPSPDGEKDNHTENNIDIVDAKDNTNTVETKGEEVKTPTNAPGLATRPVGAESDTFESVKTIPDENVDELKSELPSELVDKTKETHKDNTEDGSNSSAEVFKPPPQSPSNQSRGARPKVSAADYSALKALSKRSSNPKDVDSYLNKEQAPVTPEQVEEPGLGEKRKSLYHIDREEEEEDKRDAHHENAWRRVSVRVHINSTMSRLSRSAKRTATAKNITTLKHVKSTKTLKEEDEENCSDDEDDDVGDAAASAPNESASSGDQLAQTGNKKKVHMSDVVMETLSAIRLQRAFRRHRAYLLQVMLRDRLKVTHINVLKAGCVDALGSYERAGRDEHENLFFIKESDQDNVLHIIKRVVIKDPRSQGQGEQFTSIAEDDMDADVQTEESWVLIRVQDNKAHALYYQEGETAIAQAYPTATGWQLGNDGVVPLPVTELVHDKTPQSCYVVNGAGSPHVNLVFEQAGDWEGVPNYQAASFVFDDSGELVEETIVLRRITYGMFEDFVWIIAGVQESGENKVYYVNSEMGALTHPPTLGWGLGQDGVNPPPSLTNRRFSHSDLLPEKGGHR